MKQKQYSEIYCARDGFCLYMKDDNNYKGEKFSLKYTGNLILAPGHKEDPYIRDFSRSACGKTNCTMCCFGPGRQEWTPECRWIHSGDRHYAGSHLPPWLCTSLWFLDVCSIWWSGCGNQAAIRTMSLGFTQTQDHGFVMLSRHDFGFQSWPSEQQAIKHSFLFLSLSHIYTHTLSFSLTLLSLSLSLYWITGQKYWHSSFTFFQLFFLHISHSL